jgi:hypothetical protein
MLPFSTVIVCMIKNSRMLLLGLVFRVWPYTARGLSLMQSSDCFVYASHCHLDRWRFHRVSSPQFTSLSLLSCPSWSFTRVANITQQVYCTLCAESLGILQNYMRVEVLTTMSIVIMDVMPCIFGTYVRMFSSKFYHRLAGTRYRWQHAVFKKNHGEAFRDPPLAASRGALNPPDCSVLLGCKPITDYSSFGCNKIGKILC